MSGLTGDDIRVAISAASPLNDPRLSEIDWDAVAYELNTGSKGADYDDGEDYRVKAGDDQQEIRGY